MTGHDQSHRWLLLQKVSTIFQIHSDITKEILLCRYRPKWDKKFRSKNQDEWVKLMELDWTQRFVKVIDNLQTAKTDINFRLKHILTLLNQVFRIVFCMFCMNHRVYWFESLSKF